MTDLTAVCAICFLAGMLVLAVAGTSRPDNSRFQCLNNLRQLAASWRMYADDNGGGLVYNRDGSGAGGSAGSESWVAGWLDYSSNSQNTNTGYLVDHSRYPNGAFLGPYLKTASVFKCPSDKSVAIINGRQLPRARSVSLNRHIGAGSTAWSGVSSRYRLYSNISQMLSPASLYVFVDEREDSINDGSFGVAPDLQYQMIDFPANYHEGAANFGFADGRIETHAWKDPRTMPLLVPGTFIPLNVNIPGDVDITWINQHTAELR